MIPSFHPFHLSGTFFKIRFWFIFHLNWQIWNLKKLPCTLRHKHSHFILAGLVPFFLFCIWFAQSEDDGSNNPVTVCISMVLVSSRKCQDVSNFFLCLLQSQGRCEIISYSLLVYPLFFETRDGCSSEIGASKLIYLQWERTMHLLNPGKRKHWGK